MRLIFESTDSLRVGDVVRYRPEWCREEELDLRSVVIEAYDDVKRAKLLNLNSKLSLPPIESVTYDMIEVTDDNIYDVASDRDIEFLKRRKVI